jgi:hypothetical protein
MLLAHAVTLAGARSHVAALADSARTFDASVEYERVLLQLDWMHGDHIPGISAIFFDDRDAVFSIAESAIEELVEHGVDALQIELILDMLEVAWEKDTS